MLVKDQQKQSRQALEAMLGSDLFAHTLALSMAAVCIAETTDQPVSGHFTETLRSAICGELFASGMTNAEASNWFSTLMDRVAPFTAEIGASMHAAAAQTMAEQGRVQ
ncbi:hypothetical protein [Stenotrophomonas maltophilia group sp. RNC7]|uniref:hypothetical protein n=1 Tax=Stenotrophomonas maltophilia group sp. RNC7 TaxID=3071467 RepID=UPI0027E06F8F|nr:hypothetical protein [Stenotrophomonas maltophilia group sp. RNC7]MDQ4681882.1 hypothetical protein [Stenotrophomonas maltophilia group sp. RNC7]